MNGFDWVVQCLRAFLGLPHDLGDDAALDLAPDWDEVSEIVSEHYAHGYVLRGLADAGMDAIPPDVRKALESGMASIAGQNLRLCRALQNVQGVLADVGVELIALKGPVLALRTIGDVAVRPFSDIDILVRQQEVKSAVAALTAAGYRPAYPERGHITAHRMKSDSEIEFLDPDSNLVELHWKLLPPAWELSLSEDDVWSHARRTDFFGTPVWSLGDTHEILHLAVHHGAKHRWGDLMYVVDFHLLATRRVVNWENVWSAARSAGAHIALETALRVCRRVLGSDVQYNGLRWSENEKVATMLADQFAAGLRREKSTDGLERIVQYFRLRERLRERIVYAPQFARWIFVPTDKEEAIVGRRLAKIIGVPVRLVRLVVKYGLRRAKSSHQRGGQSND